MADSSISNQDKEHQAAPSLLLHFLWRGCLAGFLLAGTLHAGYILLASNFRTVLPGEVYRCAQPSPEKLEAFIRRYGIRTVVNLRGCCVNADWYREEARVTSRLNVSQEDIGFSATRIPSALAVRQLLEVLDRSAYPILFHCHQGADRTGLAAVMAVLLRTQASLAEARQHLGLASGHLSLGKTGNIDRFFELYEQWLTEQQVGHTPERFRTWLIHHYCPDTGRAEMTLIDPPGEDTPTRTVLRRRAGQAEMLKIRCRNRSTKPWDFQPGSNAGIHLYAQLRDHNRALVVVRRVGMFLATVEPGEHIDLTVPVPPLKRGRYQLYIDLNDEQVGWFLQLGNDPLVIDLEVK